MTINTSDIKLLESERMTDTANGGGRRTSRVIVDGEPGNIFPKVSRLDSVYGRVNLRKIYGAVVTANLDAYAGAHAIITDAPDDGQIHNNLFSTTSDYDTRTAARDRIESYVVAGPESRMVLYGRQLVGQQAVLVYQRVEEPLPEVGEVYCLSKETGSVTNYQQFVRVTDITHEVRTFTDGGGDFQRRLVTLEIGASLRYEFKGPDAPSRNSSVTREALVRNTTVADAARYYGIRPLAEAADEDALTIRVDSVYSPIVPTTQRESPISLASIGGAGGFMVSGPGLMSFTSPGVGTPSGLPYFFPRGLKPGSLRIRAPGGVVYGIDDGQGNIVKTDAFNGSLSGTVDYLTGSVQATSSSGENCFYEALAAVEVSQPARTSEIEITLGNRGTVYSEVLNPLPNPGSLIVDYRALGKWYRLRDNGTGAVSGNDPAYGTGTIDYVTGALVITLGALPDVESSVIISWGSPVDYVIRAGATSDAATGLKQTFTLGSLPVQPGSLSLSFTNSETAYTATANSSGVISGNGVTGRVNHATGVVDITYTTRLPNSGSMVAASYNQLVPSDPGNPINVTGSINWHSPPTLTPAPIQPGSFSSTMEISNGPGIGSVTGAVIVKDDGAGLLIVDAGQIVGSTSYHSVAKVSTTTTIGTINYTTGAVSIPDVSSIVPVQYRVYSGVEWSPVALFINITTTPGTYVYTQAGGDPVQTARTDEFGLTDAPLIVDLTSTTADAVVPGSVLFTINGSGQTFFDRNGTIYTDLNVTTGSALSCGTINYDTGRVSLTGQWPEGASTITLDVQCCLTVYGEFSAVDAFFRTAGSPLRPASFYVQASALDGALISGTSDANGIITGPKVRGEVVQDMGMVRVEFGEEIATVWTPIEIAPSTLRYSAVVLSNLPLNADILGLDPVRLPSDGRVPIYRPADVVVIHHTDGFTLPNPAVAGSTYSVGRADLAELWLVDADGDKVPTTKYTVNLAAGSVTMAADLDLTGYTQPLTARHRIEEMQLLSDVQINGILGITSPLSREFPADSYVSSALLFGDLNASVTALFDQATWTSVWSDELIGSGATAQFNDIDYPIEVLNDGAVTDRWRINFTTGNPSSGTANFQVISENLGVIATGNTGTDCAPVNGLTGKPYFVIRAGGWGLGWSVGNQLRFNTQAAAAPIWVARTVLPGATLAGDQISISLRGDADA